MKEMFLCDFAESRRLRKVFSANGQPQWRRKARMVGWLGSNLRFGWVRAREPRVGGSVVVDVFVEGERQEESSCWNVMVV